MSESFAMERSFIVQHRAVTKKKKAEQMGMERDHEPSGVDIVGNPKMFEDRRTRVPPKQETCQERSPLAMDLYQVS